MWSAATVLVCALDLLGRSAGSFPPIVLLDRRPPNVSAQADAFVQIGENTIFLMTSAPAFQELQRSPSKCGNVNAMRKLASVLIHEEWHVRNGPNERGAYEAQLMALASLRVGPGNPVYASVSRAMARTMQQEAASRAGPPAERTVGALAGDPVAALRGRSGSGP